MSGSPSSTPTAPAPASPAAPDRDAVLRATMATLRKRYPDAQAVCLGVPLAPPPAEAASDVDHAPAPETAFAGGEPVLAEFIRSMLLWEATLAQAASAMRRFEQHLVDVNELRICMPAELVRLLGERYPRAQERAVRLRTALNQLFRREHAVTLEHLPTLTKKESREYLESLEGVPGFVSARVQLVSIGGHAAPVDRRILGRLVSAGFVDGEATPDAAASLLERKIQAGEMLEAYALLQAWADDQACDDTPAGTKKPDAAPKRKPPAKPSKKPGANSKKKSS